MKQDLAQSQIVAEYCRRTPTSASLAKRAAETFPGGIVHDARYMKPYPLYVARAQASRKWDVDGNEYVDYSGGHGALLLGHNHPQVTEAVSRQLALGTHYGACHELEIRWGELVRQLIPSAQHVRFTSSGTEATLLALRLARAFTGKAKIMRFFGHFHGWHDHMAFGVGPPFNSTPTPGVLPELAEKVVLAPPGDAEETQRLIEGEDDLAAVILEPTGGSWGKYPVAPEFVRGLREWTKRRGVLLIFDEVICGFRCSPGGAQAALGVTPDLTTLAKILAGGLPGGAVVGRRELLDQLAIEDGGTKRADKVPHHGTYNANPLSAAAGIATLEIVAAGEACQAANDYAERLRAELNRVLTEESVPWLVYGTYSGFHVFTNPENRALEPNDFASGKVDYRIPTVPPRPELVTKLRLGMLIHGVELFSWPGGPTSAVHTEADLEKTVEAFQTTIGMLKAEGEIA